jgi:ankyrin repeat protein
LLGAGADPNADAALDDGVTALQAAIANHDIGAIIALVTCGANINAQLSPEDGTTPLAFAAASGDVQMTWHLLVLGADSNHPVHQHDRGRTPLQAAAGEGKIETVKYS